MSTTKLERLDKHAVVAFLNAHRQALFEKLRDELHELFEHCDDVNLLSDGIDQWIEQFQKDIEEIDDTLVGVLLGKTIAGQKTILQMFLSKDAKK